MSKLSGLAFLENDEVLVAKDATDERAGVDGGYTLFRKAAVSGVGGTCFACSSGECSPCEVTELARPL